MTYSLEIFDILFLCPIVIIGFIWFKVIQAKNKITRLESIMRKTGTYRNIADLFRWM